MPRTYKKRPLNPHYGGLWTDDPGKDEMLEAWYSTVKPQEIANRINSKFGTRFSAGAIHERAQTLGLKGSDCQGLLTITDAAKELGVSPSVLSHFIDRHGLTKTGKGYYRFLTDETWRAAQAYYPKPPEPCIDTVEAAKRLNYTRNSLTKLFVKTGKLRAYKVGPLWKVSVADVERMEREQKGIKYL